jgi:hypothetical protein
MICINPSYIFFHRYFYHVYSYVYIMMMSSFLLCLCDIGSMSLPSGEGFHVSTLDILIFQDFAIDDYFFVSAYGLTSSRYVLVSLC